MEDIELYVELSADFLIASTVRTDIVITVIRPHIVAGNRCHNNVIFLISQFHNIDDTHYQKVEWYAKLISGSRYKVMYYPVEIGAIAYIPKDN